MEAEINQVNYFLLTAYFPHRRFDVYENNWDYAGRTSAIVDEPDTAESVIAVHFGATVNMTFERGLL